LHDPCGKPIGYAGRRIDDHQALQFGKWKFPQSFPKNGILYNIHRIDVTTTESLTVVECPWGVMRLHQLNIPSVALLGVHISPFQQDLLTKFPCIILMLDGDQAGKAATDRFQKTLATKTDVRHVMLPQGKDPDDINDDLLIQMVQ
jgi:DNA primase